MIINASTGVIRGKITAAAGSVYAVKVTASGPGSPSVSFSWNVTPATSVVSLAGLYNVTGIGTLGTWVSGGGTDGASYVFASSLLGTSLSYQAVTFVPEPANAPDAVYGVTVPVSPAQFKSLYLIEAGVFGAQTNQPITVNYTDGTTSAFQQSFSDWALPQSFAGETTVKHMAYRLNFQGNADGLAVNLYAYSFPLAAGKTAKSVTLPGKRNVVIFGVAWSTN